MSGSNEEKMLRLRATVRQIYGGRLLLPGDPFPAPVPERVARPLIAHHFASEDHGTYFSRRVVADTPPSLPVIEVSEERPATETPPTEPTITVRSRRSRKVEPQETEQ